MQANEKTTMKILCLIDNPVKPGDRWLWNYLPSSNDEVDFQVATGAVDRFKKWGKLITYYPAFMRSGLRAFVKTRKTPYDVVIAWGGAKMDLPTPYCEVCSGRKPRR